MTTLEPEQYPIISQHTITNDGEHITLSVQRDIYTGACSVGMDTNGYNFDTLDQVGELFTALLTACSHLSR